VEFIKNRRHFNGRSYCNWVDRVLLKLS